MTLTVDEALARIIEHAGRQPAVATPLADALGLVLAEPVVSDIDSPPFTKSLMDGYAIRAADLTDGIAELMVVEVLTAGKVPTRPVTVGTAVQIMTGAPMPDGADSVVMVERSTQVSTDRVRLDDRGFRAGQNVMQRGEELKQGQQVLEPGHLLGAPEIGLLATVGWTEPKVYRRPTIAVLSTGDEIVPPERKPAPGQIRNSNDSTIVASARSEGEVTSLGIVRDNPEAMVIAMRQGLKSDCLILSGGVSAGTRDLVPETLQKLGVEEVLHHVDFKPGKPVWFGKHERGLVFGLPGNPVSVLVCFEVFVRTALRARQGRRAPLPPILPAQLAKDFHYPTKRLTYHPASTRVEREQLLVEPVGWSGSPDLCSVCSANAFLICPATDQPHRAGATMNVLPISRA